jgi:hypothetical protein
LSRVSKKLLTFPADSSGQQAPDYVSQINGAPNGCFVITLSGQVRSGILIGLNGIYFLYPSKHRLLLLPIICGWAAINFQGIKKYAPKKYMGRRITALYHPISANCFAL